MSSTNELMRRNKSLTEINEKLSAKVVSIEAELKQMRRRVALDEDFASYINSRDESLRKVLRSELSKERATRLEGSMI